MRLWSIVIGLVVVVVVVGAVLFVATTPEVEDEIIEEETTLVPDDSDVGGNLLQMGTETLPGDDTAGTPGGIPAPPGAGAEADSAADTGEGVIISMTDSGFVPDTVTIEAGTTVTFVNDGQGSHWPASDVHPTHEILSDFDSKRGLTTGEQYSYTFTEPGTWNFHDHLVPRFGGTVTVR